MEKRIQEIRELEKKIAPAPWQVENDNEGMPMEYEPFWIICGGDSADDASEWFAELHTGFKSDAEFIALVRNNILDIMDDNDRLRAENAQLQRERDAAVYAAEEMADCIASAAFERCDICILRDEPCPQQGMNAECAFEYRGPQEVEHG